VEGSAIGNPPFAALALVCRDYIGGFLGGLVQLIETSSAFIVELHVVMLAIVKAHLMLWTKISIASDAQMVVRIINQKLEIPWSLSNKWQICKSFVRMIDFFCTHVYREGNVVVNAMANVKACNRWPLNGG